MVFRAPFLRRTTTGASAPAESMASSVEGRPVRPSSERTGPVRTPAGATALTSAASVNASPVEQFLGVAYQVFDQYLEEGRKFAEGRSAWYDGATAERTSSRVSGAPANVSELFSRLASEVLGAVGDHAQGRPPPERGSTVGSPERSASSREASVPDWVPVPRPNDDTQQPVKPQAQSAVSAPPVDLPILMTRNGGIPPVGGQR